MRITKLYLCLIALALALPAILSADSMEQITDSGSVIPTPDITIKDITTDTSRKMVTLQQPGGGEFPIPLKSVKMIIFGDYPGDGRLFDVSLKGDFGNDSFPGARVYYYENGWFLASPAAEAKKYWIKEERLASMSAVEEIDNGFGGEFDQPTNDSSGGFGDISPSFGTSELTAEEQEFVSQMEQDSSVFVQEERGVWDRMSTKTIVRIGAGIILAFFAIIGFVFKRLKGSAA